MTIYGETAESHVSKGQSSDLNVLYLQEMAFTDDKGWEKLCE